VKQVKKKPVKKQCWQVHHVQYASPDPRPDWTVRVTRGEHFLLTQLQRFGSLSDGAKTALLFEMSTKETRPEPDQQWQAEMNQES
jgi:hypothetical protein